MTRISFIVIAVLGLVAVAGAAQPQAQGPQAPGAAPTQTPPEDLSPAVDTSAPTPSAQPAKQATGETDVKSGSAQTAAAGAAKAASGTSKAAADTGKSRDAKGSDRLELGTTEISGNRELPKVLYVVPWRRPEIGDAVGRPPNSLVEEALTPVDRDVFRRQNRYYAALEAGAAPAKSQPAAAGAGPAHAARKDER